VLVDGALAFAAGMLTVASPCVLPTLPILLGVSVGRQDAWRPLYIAAGFTLTFSLLALGLGASAAALGLGPETWRNAATALLALCGVLMIWPAPFERLVAAVGGTALSRAGTLGGRGDGLVGGLLVGASLGAVWTPCAGPVLGSILTLVATAPHLGRAAALLVAFAVGASIPMLGIAYGGQWATTRARALLPYTQRLQRVFGVVVIGVAVIVHLRYDVALAAKAMGDVPDPPIATLGDYGEAPEFAAVDAWLNSAPLTMAGLRGKVVLVDFWTYDCINCARTLPHVARLHEHYASRGLVVVGVHTPEFTFERETAGVRAAIERFGIRYPVAQDNAYGTWKAYGNHYWPAQYLIDRRGHIVLEHQGEGGYDEMDEAIRHLLADSGPAAGP
jgi:cytochrome c biogenesis protein CcdA/thiol-disulfide isomerase/thioredoxin